MGTTYSWRNPAGGSFGDQDNWIPIGVPGSLDAAVFSLAGPYTVSGDGDVGSIVVSAAVTFTGSIEAAGTTGYFIAFDVNGGSATFDGPGAVLYSPKEANIGNSSDGTLTFENGATGTLTATVTLNAMGTVIAGANALDVAYAGPSSTPSQASDSGVVVVDGTGSSLTLLGGAYIGAFGNGTLAITNGGLVQQQTEAVGYDSFEVGRQTGSTGTVTVTSGGTLDVGEFAVIGDGGDGIISFNDGATGTFSGLFYNTPAADFEAAAAIYLGGNGGSGTLSVDGTTTVVTADEGLFVGQYGNGLVSLTNGATLAVYPTDPTFAAVELGVSGGATGTLDVSGGAALTGTAELLVGVNADATGALDITTGGSVYADAATGSASIIFGEEAGATGSGVIDDGLLDSEQAISVGYSGSGTLTVQDGGTLEVDNAYLRVARNLGGNGLLTVDDAEVNATGAELTVGPIVNLGDGASGGSGVLEIENNGVVSVGSAVIGGLAGGTGSIDVNNAVLTLSGNLSTGAGTSTITEEYTSSIGISGTATIGGGGGGALVQVTHGAGFYDYGGGITLAALGTLAVDTSIFLASNGPITLDGGTLLALGAVQFTAANAFKYDGIDVTGGTTADPSAIIGTAGGTATIGDGITFVTASTIDGGITTVVPDVLLIDSTFDPSNEIYQFTVGDTIDIAGEVYNTASYDTADDTLTLTNVVDPMTLSIDNDGSFTATSFVATPDGNGGTDISLGGPTCYVAGTGIRTPTGDVPVEALQPGDAVTTAAGIVRPIRWIGRRRIDLSRHPRPDLAQPIRIRAGAIADGIPGRDLLVSPDHAVCIDGALIPARLLLNGVSIRQETRLAAVTYFHVELDRHDLLLAEGLAAESYLDTGNRDTFENAGGAMVLHPDFAAMALAVAPEIVAPRWLSLARRAGAALPSAAHTTDAAPRLQIGDRTIRPLHAADGRLCFALPPGARRLRLTSRAAVPAWRAPWLDDRRCLGLAVSRLRLRHDGAITDIALDSPLLSDGWWGIERSGQTAQRWTSGDAVITLPCAADALELSAFGLDAYPLADRTTGSADQRSATRRHADG